MQVGRRASRLHGNFSAAFLGVLVCMEPSHSTPGPLLGLQVKGEQDWALQQLRDRAHPFRASPLPLSTMAPRYQRQQEQQLRRRQAAHDQRRQELLELQQPFGFEEREAERLQRRQLVHGAGTAGAGAAGVGRPHTPSFHAQLVPPSTTEVRQLGCRRRCLSVQLGGTANLTVQALAYAEK
jgi:hypothetical protein